MTARKKASPDVTFDPQDVIAPDRALVPSVMQLNEQRVTQGFWPKMRRVVGVAQAGDEVGDGVDRHHEIGQRREHHPLGGERRLVVARAVPKRQRLAREGHVGGHLAHLRPEAAGHPPLVQPQHRGHQRAARRDGLVRVEAGVDVG